MHDPAYEVKHEINLRQSKAARRPATSSSDDDTGRFAATLANSRSETREENNARGSAALRERAFVRSIERERERERARGREAFERGNKFISETTIGGRRGG